MAFDGRVISNVGVLAAVVQSGSLARAAESLGLSRSGVSRALSRLESSVGVRLLDRTTRAVSLTDEGRKLYAEVAPLLTGIEDAVTVTAGTAVVVRGRLRVNVDAFFSHLLLTPHLPELLALHPELSVELIAKDQLGDLIGEGFDIAIRFGTPPASSLVAQKLLETRTITVAAPTYLEARGRPSAPGELARHACILVRDSLTGRPIDEWTFRRAGKAARVQIAGRLLVAEWGTMLGACVAGAGIARVKAIGVQHLLERRSLVELLPEWSGEAFPLYALYPSRHLPAAKLRAFIDFIRARVLSSQGTSKKRDRPRGEAGGRSMSVNS
jgi:DNA-binding transcriptional LysR family regulator